MAALRPKISPVGSSQWVLNERHQANQYVDEEVEAFTFSVRNDMEWLNEHMADIFSRNQMNVTDVFKTPGKLRGKTPRTARKRNPQEARAPLTDIFAPNSSNTPSQAQTTPFFKQIARFQVAEDPVIQSPEPQARKPVPFMTGKENTDSGYYGNTQEELESAQEQEAFNSPFKPVVESIQEQKESPSKQREMIANPPVEERRITEESFVSAKEDIESKNASKEDLHGRFTQEEDDVTVADDEMQHLMSQAAKVSAALDEQPRYSLPHKDDDEPEENLEVFQQAADINDHMDVDTPRSTSDGSSPAKPLVRKSSLTFAPLPGRDILASNKSIGARISRISHLEQIKPNGATRGSNYGRITGGKSLGATQQSVRESEEHDEDEDEDVEMADESTRGLEGLEAANVHTKTSTQRLHERINLLGQSKDSRMSREVAMNSQTGQLSYPSLPSISQSALSTSVNEHGPSSKPLPNPAHQSYKSIEEDDEDDWISPVIPTTSATASQERPQLVKYQTMEVMEDIRGKSNIGNFETLASPLRKPAAASSTPQRPPFGIFGHGKSASTSVVTSPIRDGMAPTLGHAKHASVSNPELPAVVESTTPTGSPTSRKFDGPLSASKAKFFSVLRSAKEKIITGAGVSAKAKLETLSPGIKGSRSQHQGPSLDDIFSPVRDTHTVPGVYPEANTSTKDIANKSVISLSPTKAAEPRRTRSSSEREQKRKEQAVKEEQRSAALLERAREQERMKASVHHQKSNSTISLGQSQSSQASSTRSGAQSRAENLGTTDEDINSADEMPPPPPKSLLPMSQVPKPKETRRIIKPVKESGSQKSKPPVIRVAINRFPQPGQTAGVGAGSSKQPVPSKTSNDSLKSSTKASNDSLKSSTKASNDSLKSSTSQPPRLRALEIAAQKKKEEEKMAQRKAELKREQEQKRAAKLEEERQLEQQRRATEQQRAQEARKAAQKQAVEAKQRQQANRPQSRQATTLAQSMQAEKAATASQHPRGDLGASRPLSRLNAAQEPSRPIPQINPAKPPKRVFQADDDEPVQRSTIQRGGPPFQTLEAKRRRTIDEEEEQQREDSRRSVMAPPVRQSIRKEPTKFTHGYMAAPHPGQHSSSLLIKTVTAQHSKSGHSNEMSRFANAKIPFAEAANPPSASTNTFQASSSTATTITKTPLRPVGPSKHPKSAAKSPAYPSGDNIALPEIATDSEDEDSDNEFKAPSWVESPILGELLSQQQLVDPEQIFGPIPPLQMDEMFKNKDRQKRFRDRTSSALWVNDKVTEEERRADREARERFLRDGGWSFTGK